MPKNNNVQPSDIKPAVGNPADADVLAQGIPAVDESAENEPVKLPEVSASEFDEDISDEDALLTGADEGKEAKETETKPQEKAEDKKVTPPAEPELAFDYDSAIAKEIHNYEQSNPPPEPPEFDQFASDSDKLAANTAHELALFKWNQAKNEAIASVKDWYGRIQKGVKDYNVSAYEIIGHMQENDHANPLLAARDVAYYRDEQSRLDEAAQKAIDNYVKKTGAPVNPAQIIKPGKRVATVNKPAAKLTPMEWQNRGIKILEQLRGKGG